MTALLCITCSVYGREHPRRPNVPFVCDGDRTRLANDLGGIPDSYAAVAEHIEPGRTGAERRTVGFESRPPLNIAALSLLLPGSDTPAAVLHFWAQDWATQRDETIPQPYVYSSVEYLTLRLDWACAEYHAVDGFAMDIRDLAGALRAYRPKPTGRPAGRCPRKPDDRRCGAQLFVDSYEDVIHCERCGASWDRRQGEWTALRANQVAAGMGAA